MLADNLNKMVASLQILFIFIKFKCRLGGGSYSTAAIVNFSLKEVKTRKRRPEMLADLCGGGWMVCWYLITFLHY